MAEFKPFLSKEKRQSFYDGIDGLEHVADSLKRDGRDVEAYAILRIKDEIISVMNEISWRETKDFNRFHEQN